MNALLESKGKRPRRGAVLTCPGCGDEFYISPREIGRRKYCSHPCATKDQANSVVRVCSGCGSEFSKPSSVGAKWCSWACYLKSRVPRKTCKYCGTEFEAKRLTYCSVSCRQKASRNSREKPCEVCGKPMRVAPYQESSKRFCSQACHNEAKKIKGIGFRRMRQDGYIEVYYPSHPDSTKRGVMLEHRLIAEKKYGCRILKTEHVHHINGDRADNRIENLELWNKSQPAGQRVTDKIAWAIELLGKYHPELLADQAVQLRLVAS